MNVPSFPLYCYWGGEITQNNGDVSYRGGNQKFVFVNAGMSFFEVLNKLYEGVGSDPRFISLKVLMRYPMPRSYVAIPLDDDNSLRAMWLAVTQTSATTMQLFIEQVPKEPVQSNFNSSTEMDYLGVQEQQIPLPNQSMGMGSFSRMLLDDEFVTEHLSQIGSPIQSTVIGNHTNTQSQGIIDSLDPNNVDVFGDNDFGNDSDEDDDEDTIEANDKIIRESAPTQDFNEAPETDHSSSQAWMTWTSSDKFTSDGEFQVGQEFDSLQQLKDAVKSYSIARNQTIRVVEVDSEKYVVECKRKQDCKCPWRLRGVRNPSLLTFKIVRYTGPHAANCLGDIDSVDHKLLTSDFVCNDLLDVIRVDPSLKIKTIVQLVKEKFHFTITYKRAWLAKQKAITSIYGDWEVSYQDLPKYMQALKESNVGTIVEWRLLETTDPSVHVCQRVFWAFKPSIDGFRHCRPLITIDGTHLYGRYKGVLLIAMGTDANFQLFPLAFAIVESENNDSWRHCRTSAAPTCKCGLHELH